MIASGGKNCCLLALAVSFAGIHAQAQIGDLSLADAQGKIHAIGELKNHQATVFLFVNSECPVSNGFCPVYEKLHRDFAGKGIGFFAVYCQTDLSPAEIILHGKEYKILFPQLLDPKQALAKRVKICLTPEAVVVDAKGKTLYQGRINDWYAPNGKRKAAPARQDLEEALKEIVAGKAITAPRAPGFGCPLPPAP